MNQELPPPLKKSVSSKRAKSFISSITSSAAAATRIVALQAERTKITTLTLPAAYRALGKDCLQNRRCLDGVDELTTQLRAVIAEIKKISESALAPSIPTTLAEKAKGAGKQAIDLARQKQLGMKRDTLIANIGKAIYDQYLGKSGPIALVGSIELATHRLSQIEGEISSLSAKDSRSPMPIKWLVFAAFIGLLGIGITAKWLFWNKSPSLIAASGKENDIINMPSRESLPQAPRDIEKISQEGKNTSKQIGQSPLASITSGITKSAIESGKNQEKLARERREKEEAEQKVLDQARKDKTQRNEDLLLKANQEKAAIEATRKERADMARKKGESLFRLLSFVPQDTVFLSKSLRKSGASVEIIGPDYQLLRTMHEKSDWLGLINYVHHGKRKQPLLTDFPLEGVSGIIGEIAAPTASSIDGFFYFDIKVNGDFTTMNDAINAGVDKPYLFAFQIPIQRDSFESWELSLNQGVMATRAGSNLGLKGSLASRLKYGNQFNWTPLSLYLVGLDTEPSKKRPFFFANKIHEKYGRFKNDLDKTSSQMSREDYEKAINRELQQFYREIEVWMDNF